MKRFPSLSVIAILLIFFAGCTKTGPQGPAGPALTGALFGFVSLDDQYGARVSHGLASTTVTLSSATTSPVTVSTDSTGKYTFPNLATGQYTISYSNPGYGSINNVPFGFLGGGNIDRDARLSAIPNFGDSTFNVVDSAGYLVLSGTLSGTDTKRRTVAVFVGSAGTVSATPANYSTFYNTLTNNSNNTINNFVLKIAVSDLNDAGFTSGSVVYLAVYGAAANFSSTSDYEDYSSTGRLYYTALSENPYVASIMLP
jgi:hypothetical protein